MPGFVPDTSCMVAALCAWHDDHESATSELNRRLSQRESMILAAPALVEAYAVLTRLPPPHRLSPSDALRLLDSSFMSAGRTVALDAASYRGLLRQAATDAVAGGACVRRGHRALCAEGKGVGFADLQREAFLVSVLTGDRHRCPRLIIVAVLMGRAGRRRRGQSVCSCEVGKFAIAAGAVFVMLRVPPEEAVRQSFAEYKRAVMADDGAAAAGQLSAATVQWYGKMQDLALHGSKEEVEQLGPLEKIQVLAFRQRVPADELRAMSPRQLVAYSVTHGWVGKVGTGRSELGPVTASSDTAVANVLLGGKDSGKQYHFVREDGRWLFNQLPTLEESDDELKAAAAQRGMPVDQFVQALIESGSGKKITPDLWQPPFPRSESRDSQ